MINIKELTKEDIGRWIVYNDGLDNLEYGKLKSWNDNTIFVVFKCNDEWDNFQNYTGQSCSPKNLTFEDFHWRYKNEI